MRKIWMIRRGGVPVASFETAQRAVGTLGKTARRRNWRRVSVGYVDNDGTTFDLTSTRIR